MRKSLDAVIYAQPGPKNNNNKINIRSHKLIFGWITTSQSFCNVKRSVSFQCCIHFSLNSCIGCVHVILEPWVAT